MRSAPSHRASTTWAPLAPMRCTMGSTIPTMVPGRSRSSNNEITLQSELFLKKSSSGCFLMKIHSPNHPCVKWVVYSISNPEDKMSERETYTLHQTLKLSEILLGAYYIASRTKIIKIVFFLVLVIGVLREVLELFLSSQGPIKWYMVIYDALVSPLFIFLFFFVFISLGVLLLTIIRPGNYRDLTYRFTHWGMKKSGKNIDVSIPWNKFLRLRESKHFLFLYISESDAHFFHKKTFESQLEIEDFKQFVSCQISHD